MKYQGQCHCKAITFEIESPTITTALQCNCSICRRKNAPMSSSYFSGKQFTLLTGQENLSNYTWGDHDVNHFFCKTCGIYPFHELSYQPGTYRINLACIDDIELEKLDVSYFDGKNEL